MDYKKYIAGKINIVGASAEEIASYITVPPAGDMGDFALPCFRFAKILRKPPAAIAEDVKNSFVTDSVVCGVSAVNGYLNFKIDRSAFVTETLKKIASHTGEMFGNSEIECGNFRNLSVEDAQRECARFLEDLKNDRNNFEYPKGDQK